MKVGKRKDGKGDDGNVHKGRIPLTDCAMTGGRTALLSMFEMQGFCDLTYSGVPGIF